MNKLLQHLNKDNFLQLCKNRHIPDCDWHCNQLFERARTRDVRKWRVAWKTNNKHVPQIKTFKMWAHLWGFFILAAITTLHNNQYIIWSKRMTFSFILRLKVWLKRSIFVESNSKLKDSKWTKIKLYDNNDEISRRKLFYILTYTL